MKKQNTNYLMWILIILAVLILFRADWTKPTINQFVIAEKEGTSLGSNLNTNLPVINTNINPAVLLTVSPTPFCLNDNIVGTVTSNLPGANCSVQIRFTNLMPWITLANITLDSNGGFSQNTTASQTGVLYIKVLCDNTESNEQQVTVNSCSTLPLGDIACEDLFSPINQRTCDAGWCPDNRVCVYGGGSCYCGI